MNESRHTALSLMQFQTKLSRWFNIVNTCNNENTCIANLLEQQHCQAAFVTEGLGFPAHLQTGVICQFLPDLTLSALHNIN